MLYTYMTAGYSGSMDIELVKHYLKHCVELAHSRLGFTAPNPAVGAVIVEGDVIIAQGAHYQAGQPHAEVMAFRAANECDLSLATLFVSLEPCCHHGRTPPCTDAIIQSGIKQVYFAHQDQNPEVAGQSKAILEQAGVRAELVAINEAQALYRYYDYWRQHDTPWVTAKLAMSKDGCYKSHDGSPIAITGDTCREFTHQQRLQADGIVTTLETVLADDPQLNVRLDGHAVAKPVIVIDRQLNMPLGAKLWHTANPLTICYDEAIELSSIEPYKEEGATLVALPCVDGHLSWQAFIQEFGRRGLHHLWVEAGGRFYRHLWQTKTLQDAYLYVGNTVFGNQDDAGQLGDIISSQQLASAHCQSAGEDTILSFPVLF